MVEILNLVQKIVTNNWNSSQNKLQLGETFTFNELINSLKDKSGYTMSGISNFVQKL